MIRPPDDPSLVTDLPSLIGPIDGVTSLSDRAATVLHRLAERLGLAAPGERAAQTAHDKAALRQRTNQSPEPLPWVRAVSPSDLDRLVEVYEGPVILKPIGGSGSLGVWFAETSAEARARVERVASLSRSGAAIVEAASTASG